MTHTLRRAPHANLKDRIGNNSRASVRRTLSSLKERKHLVDILFARGPAGAEAAEGLPVVAALPDGNGGLLADALQILVVQPGKDLIRAGVDKEFVALLDQCRADFLREPHAVAAGLKVVPAAHKNFEINAEEPPLGKHCALLLLEREEMLHETRIRDDKRLADERPALRSSDIEDICQTGNVGERRIVRL